MKKKNNHRLISQVACNTAGSPAFHNSAFIHTLTVKTSTNSLSGSHCHTTHSPENGREVRSFCVLLF